MNPAKKVTRTVTQTVSRTAKRASRIEPTDIAKGAAAISIATGMIAAGAALMDRENRRRVGKTAKKGMEFMQDMAEEAGGRYQAVAQKITKGRSSKKQSKGRSKKR